MHVLAMHMALQFALPMVLILWPIHIYHPFASADPGIALTGCRSACGNVNISYPFGMDNSRCYVDHWFEIECRNNSGIEKPFLKSLQLEVLVIDASSAKVVIMNPIYQSNCVSESQSRSRSRNETEADWAEAIDMRGSPFVYSQDNRFVGVGCNTRALLRSNGSEVGGCFSFCDENDKAPSEILRNGSCRGRYCCDTSLPEYLLEYNPAIEPMANRYPIKPRDSKDDCSHYAVIAEGNWIDHESGGSLGHLEKLSYVPAVLEWEILNSTPQFRDTYYRFCYGTNILSSNSTGFRCQCKDGFGGDPYVSQGCTVTPSNIPEPTESKTKLVIIVGVFSTMGSLLFLIGVWWLYKILRKRRKRKRKEKYFKQNGGLLLKQKLSSGEINFDNTKLFNSKDLEKATDHFNVNRVLGKGGQGTVYKGMLVDGQIVAVKKFKVKGNVEEFINEVVILSQINHRNVVKLLGFCLETEVPLLVYEFIPNGNLFEYLHEQNEELQMTWEIRLRIAGEVAGALFYLHSAASQPIYHRDIKSTNILLDEKYRAKVADFGTSRMVSIETTHLTTRVQGTLGYLDPEYLHTSQFTEKSDVYSFGVVLVELLTGQKPISSIRLVEGEAKNLASYFIKCMEEDRVFDILDKRILEGEKKYMMAVAKLAKRCLAFNGRKRPTMREVIMELEEIQKLGKRSNLQPNHEEIELARTEVYQSWIADCTSTGSNVNSKASSSSMVLPLVPIK